MWDLCTNALDTAKLRGATYGDVRVMHLRQRDLTTKNGQVGTLAQSESLGLGLRLYGPFDTRRPCGLCGAGRFHRQGFGTGKTQRGRSCPGKGLRGQLAEPVP